MIKLRHYLFGSVQLRLIGFSPERFLNLCRAHRLEIWGLEHHKDCYQFYMTLKSYRKVRPLVHKSHVKLRIISRLGFPFFLYRNRKRKLFAAGLSLFFVFLYALSLFIWDIKFEGNRQYTKDVLMTYFNNRNITYGMLKAQVSCDQIEDYLRTDFPEITWVSARISGTRLLVKVKENEVVSEMPDKKQTSGNVVAQKDGIIKEMIVRAGTVKVKVGDTIEKGQLLVSGEVVITNDSEEVVQIHYVQADADILAQTEYHYRKKIPAAYAAVAETGRQKNGYYFRGFQYSYVLMLPSKTNAKWKYSMEEKQVKIFDDFYLPFYFGEIKGQEYDVYEHIYTVSEQKILIEQVHEKFMQDLEQKGVQILENNVKMLGSGSNCYAEGRLTAKESVVAFEEITNQEEIGASDERSGNDY